MKTCSVEECNKATRSKGSLMCEMHYYRLRRNNSLKVRELNEYFISSNGYIKVLDHSHPLKDNQGYVYKHRQVLFDSSPDMNCVHCGKERTWEDCHVDHLDVDITNNNLDNLGISCPSCNIKRGSEKSKQSMRDRYAVHEFNGETLCISEWAERIGISDEALGWRLKHWTNKEDIFTKKRGVTGPLKKEHKGK